MTNTLTNTPTNSVPTTRADSLAALQAALPGLAWTTEAERLALLSRDFSWFSPILKAELEGKRAELAVRPRDEAELKQVVGACARLQLPLTLRGAGTGNYGQCTPIHGGVLVDMGALNGIVWQRGGVVRAQAGIRLAELERRTREQGFELRTMPSTFRVATLGGLFAGGFGGVGSITYGPLAAPGNVLGAGALSVEAEPQSVELRGAEALALHHNWGTTGILLEIELALAPAQTWTELAVVFETFDAALDFGNALSLAPGLPKRNVAVLAWPVPRFIARWEHAFPAGYAAALVVVAEAAEPAVRELAARWGGRVTHQADSTEAQRRNQTLLEMCWNHSTLHALKVDPGRTYLQCSFAAGQHLEQVRAAHALFGQRPAGEPGAEKTEEAEVLMHVEFIRSLDGPLICTALPLVRYSGEARLAQIIDAYRALGIRVNNPHHKHVEDGRFGGTLPPAAVAAKRRLDPMALLNPGKLRLWPPPVA
jgi:FAD/FMN-containing dehydrogenase